MFMALGRVAHGKQRDRQARYAGQHHHDGPEHIHGQGDAKRRRPAAHVEHHHALGVHHLEQADGHRQQHQCSHHPQHTLSDAVAPQRQ